MQFFHLWHADEKEQNERPNAANDQLQLTIGAAYILYINYKWEFSNSILGFHSGRRRFLRRCVMRACEWLSECAHDLLHIFILRVFFFIATCWYIKTDERKNERRCTVSTYGGIVPLAKDKQTVKSNKMFNLRISKQSWLFSLNYLHLSYNGYVKKSVLPFPNHRTIIASNWKRLSFLIIWMSNGSVVADHSLYHCSTCAILWAIESIR